MRRTIAITGASGFIGRRLVSELIREGGYNVRVLSRDRQRDVLEGRFAREVEIFEGDLGDPKSLNGFLVPGCTVINLVYLWHAGSEMNLACTRNLLEACRSVSVARLIHCSTAAVAGRVPDNLVNENTSCLPISEYGRVKLQIEQKVIEAANEHFDTVILRPTSVFGIAGEPLKKLAADISGGNRWKNYLKSCLFSKRRMNLVHVDNVVGAIIFLAQYTGRFEGEIFIISDDDDPHNNFKDVERFLMEKLGAKGYGLPRIPVPLSVLKFFLMSLGRNNINPRCDFDSRKLRALGYKSTVELRDGLAEYAAWYSKNGGRSAI